MSIIQTTNLYSNSTAFNTAVVFRTSAGAENGTLCKAWVSFRGTSTVVIRADFNVNSVTDLGPGQYRVNFSSSVTANYAPVVTASYEANEVTSCVLRSGTYSTTQFAIATFIATVGDRDASIVTAAVFR